MSTDLIRVTGGLEKKGYSGTLGFDGNNMDTFSFRLKAGDTVTITVTEDSELLWGVTLYHLTSDGEFGIVPTGAGVNPDGSFTYEYTITETGKYEWDFTALSGAGSYSLDFAIA